MNASKRANLPEGSAKMYNHQHIQGLNSFYQYPIQNINKEDHVSVQTFEPSYCTLESSSSDANTHACPNNSSSTVSFSSPNGSPVSQQNNFQSQSSDNHNHCVSPVSASCLTYEDAEISLMLKELETAMLADNLDNPETGNNLSNSSQYNGISPKTEKWNIMEMISRGDLRGLLCMCAKAIDDEDMMTTEWLIGELRQMVSVFGEPNQRIGAYMLEGLIAKLAASGSSIYKALRCKEPTGPELLTYMHILYEACPYFKFGYESANGAIAEAMKDENFVHIIDFQISQGSQWVSLIRALSARPVGTPKIRLTGIDDPASAFARQGGLEIVGENLSKLAAMFNVPFEFHGAAISGTEVELENLRIRPGEAIAVNFPLMLHHMPDESVCVENHRDRLIRLAKRLSPKVVTLVEQEANTNTAPFVARFSETLSHYSAIFESIDVKLSRDHKERINVEQHCLAREIVNLIACEGDERVERHEPLGKWKSRFSMAGFRQYPLSSFVNDTIRALLQSYSDKYTLEERDGALYLGWMNQPLVTSCAWR